MEPNTRLSEYITVILGGIGTLFLAAAAQVMLTRSGGFEELGALLLLLYQFIVSMIALPFLIKSFRRERIVPWFANIVVGEMILNGLFVLIQYIYFTGKSIELAIFYGIVILLEISPMIMYSRNKERIYY